MHDARITKEYEYYTYEVQQTEIYMVQQSLELALRLFLHSFTLIAISGAPGRYLSWMVKTHIGLRKKCFMLGG